MVVCRNAALEMTSPQLKIGLNAVSFVALAAGSSLVQQRNIHGSKALGRGFLASRVLVFSGMDDERAEVRQQQHSSIYRRERR